MSKSSELGIYQFCENILEENNNDKNMLPSYINVYEKDGENLKYYRLRV